MELQRGDVVKLQWGEPGKPDVRFVAVLDKKSNGLYRCRADGSSDNEYEFSVPLGNTLYKIDPKASDKDLGKIAQRFTKAIKATDRLKSEPALTTIGYLPEFFADLCSLEKIQATDPWIANTSNLISFVMKSAEEDLALERTPNQIIVGRDNLIKLTNIAGDAFKSNMNPVSEFIYNWTLFAANEYDSALERARSRQRRKYLLIAAAIGAGFWFLKK